MDCLLRWLGRILPVVTALFCIAGIFTCYAIAFTHGHISPPPYWAFVSEVGVTSPESSIFSLVMFWTGSGFFLSAVMVYKHNVILGLSSKVNTAALILAQLTFLGTTFVGSFQSTTASIPHAVGAMFVGGGSAAYSWMVTTISWREHRKLCPLWLIIIRTILSGLMTVSSATYGISYPFREKSETVLVFSASMEWVAMILVMSFVATLVEDLRHISGISLVVKTKQKMPYDINDIDKNSLDFERGTGQSIINVSSRRQSQS